MTAQTRTQVVPATEYYRPRRARELYRQAYRWERCGLCAAVVAILSPCWFFGAFPVITWLAYPGLTGSPRRSASWLLADSGLPWTFLALAIFILSYAISREGR